MKARYGHNSTGFTIVELMIVVIILGILAALVITTYQTIQIRARNTSMVVGVKSYIKALESYHTLTGSYPAPPDGTSSHDHQACFGNNYVNNICLIEDDGPGAVTTQTWFDNALAQVAGSRQALPQYVRWNSNGNSLMAGAFYISTKGTTHPYLNYAQVASADALVVFYLEGAVPELCKFTGQARGEVYQVGQSTTKDITVCYIPMGNYVSI